MATSSILSQLSERLDPEKLVEAARTAPIPWAQRHGYVLEHLGFSAMTAGLKDYVRQKANQSATLLPQGARTPRSS